MKKATYLLNRWALSYVLFLGFSFLSGCDYIRYIPEADIPNIKPGGLITLQGKTPGGKPFKFTSTCEVLGIREYRNEFKNYGSTLRLFTGHFQTVGKPENLILEIDFEYGKGSLKQSTFDCRISKLNGKFTLEGETYSINKLFGFEITTSALVTNLNKAGAPTFVELNNFFPNETPTDTFRIFIETALLPY